LERHSPITIRPAIDRDIPQIMALEKQSQAAAHWGLEEYRRLVGSAQGVVLVAEGGSLPAPLAASPSLLGFLVARQIPDDWELENIVVATSVCRKGIASLLLKALIATARETRSGAIFLEVRDSNAPARALYEKAGFCLQGTRKNYYERPEEDAILYTLKLL
jgi:[ribosomal protein S18]-alanine N-acetyltransferase